MTICGANLLDGHHGESLGDGDEQVGLSQVHSLKYASISIGIATKPVASYLGRAYVRLDV